MNGDQRDARIRLLMTGRVGVDVIDLGDDRRDLAWFVDGQPATGDQLAALAGTSCDDVAEALLLLELRNDMARDAAAREVNAIYLDAARQIVAKGRTALAAHPDAGNESA